MRIGSKALLCREAEASQTLFGRLMNLSLVLLLGSAFVGLNTRAQAADKPLLDARPWTAGGSDEVGSKVASTDATTRFAYDFKGAGYAFIVHPVAFNAPDNFEIDIPISGTGAGNDLQIKFDDASGDTVWWHVRPNFIPTATGMVLRLRPRHIQYAWGPVKDHAFRGGAKLEFVVVKTIKGAASGHIDIGPITWKALPPEPKVEAPLSSDRRDIVDDKPDTVWMAKDGETATLDLGRSREFGGLRLDWDGAAPKAYEIALSENGRDYQPAKTISDSDGDTDLIGLGEATARYVRLKISGSAGLKAVSILVLTLGQDRNGLAAEIAKLSARGHFPRGFQNEQAYWTVVGVPGGGSRSALLSEDGAVELGPEGASIEPFIQMDGQILSWNEAEISQGLKAPGLPLPFVNWKVKGLSLGVSVTAFGAADAPYGLARYQIANLSDQAKTLTLRLAIRPFQVNPPTQFLNRPGGVSPIRHLKLEQGNAFINDHLGVMSLTPPSGVGAGSVMGGQPFIASQASEIHDEDGLGTGYFDYALTLTPREGRTMVLAFPLAGQAELPKALTDNPEREAARLEAESVRQWQGLLSKTRLTLPDKAPPIAMSLSLAQAHILMLKDGDLLKPGARSYDRSWIRDGAMMSEGLMRTGHFEVAFDYFKAYAPFVFDSGKVPCCVDGRGADPTPENDAMGEFAWLSGELIRYGLKPEDMAFYWPKVKSVIAYQETMRQSTRIALNQSPDRARFYGLLPPSISHEGYSDKPAYSYWDDFWALKGYRGAAILATAMEDNESHNRIQAQGDEFAKELTASLLDTAKTYGLTTMAGAADRGDFDATSSTMGLTTGADTSDVPETMKAATFERYWNFINARDKDPALYTPYELRSVAAFVRLHQPKRARFALAQFFRDQTPKPWYQWAEVINVPRRKPGFIGDLPHGWVESDFLRSALDLFAYDRPELSQMVLLAGFDPKWADAKGTQLDTLYTPYGPLSLSVKRLRSKIVITINSARVPPGGFALDLTAFDLGPKARIETTGDNSRLSSSGELLIHQANSRIQINP